MPDTPKSSETGPARPLGTIELAAFGSDAAEQIADELRAALAPGIQVLRPLGAGAMGLVFLGRDPLLKRLVAIKVLSPDLAGDEVARGRFVRGARQAPRSHIRTLRGCYAHAQSHRNCPEIRTEIARRSENDFAAISMQKRLRFLLVMCKG